MAPRRQLDVPMSEKFRPVLQTQRPNGGTLRLGWSAYGDAGSSIDLARPILASENHPRMDHGHSGFPKRLARFTAMRVLRLTPPLRDRLLQDYQNRRQERAA